MASALMIALVVGITWVVSEWIEENYPIKDEKWTCVEWRNETVCSVGVSYYSEECHNWAQYFGIAPDTYNINTLYLPSINVDYPFDAYSECIITTQPYKCETKQPCTHEGRNCKEETFYWSETHFKYCMKFCSDYRIDFVHPQTYDECIIDCEKYVEERTICEEERDVA